MAEPLGVTSLGTRSFGSYVLREELGRGGMAIVYRAESRRPESFGREVALKRLLADNEFDVDFDQVRSFIEEARLATRFRHPNIARTYALGKADGAYFIEMEYVRGPTLLQVQKQTDTAGAVPISIVAQMLMQICSALEHVHELRDNAGNPLELVHRDVSLSNIIVNEAGIVKLIDFGIVKGHSSQAPTAAGVIKGKLAYIAPEYLTGSLDHRADLFAIGVIAHELLTGRRLFRSTSDLETLMQIRQARVAPPSRLRPDVPAELDAIVMRALAREPEARWQTAAELRAAIAELYGPEDPAQVASWLAWALAQHEPPKVSQVVRVIDSLELSIATPVVRSVLARTLELVAAARAARPPYLLLSLVSAIVALIFLGMYAIA